MCHFICYSKCLNIKFWCIVYSNRKETVRNLLVFTFILTEITGDFLSIFYLYVCVASIRSEDFIIVLVRKYQIVQAEI
jgi:hypothetical protein